MSKNVLILKHFESPKEAGTYFRLLCLTGVNKGESYVLMGNRIVIGRSEKADIRINDTKTSREHAEITRVGSSWVVSDLGSQNGVVVNDLKIAQQTLNEGDKVIVGQSVFKFAKVEVASKNKVIREAPEPDASKKSMLPIIILAVAFLAIFLMDDKKPDISTAPPPSNAGQSVYQDVSNEYANLQKRQAVQDKQLKEKLNAIYQRGLREYREGNFFRAIHEFNLALIIAPGDAQAEFYLRKTKEELDSSIQSFTEKAQRDTNSLKYKSAIISHCSIIRLLYSVPEDPRYKSAVEQIKDLEGKLGTETGETNCIKKQRTN